MDENTPPAERKPDNRQSFISHYSGMYALSVATARAAVDEFMAVNNPNDLDAYPDGKQESIGEVMTALTGLATRVRHLNHTVGVLEAAQNVAATIYDSEFATRGQTWQAAAE